MIKLTGVRKSFGGITAVAGVSLDLGDYPVTGLVGPNGSGKTTLFHLITGFYELDSGEIHFRGKPIHHLPAHQISRQGMVRTFQHSRVLPQITVKENLLSAAMNQIGENMRSIFFSPGKVRRQEEKNGRRADEVLEILKLAGLAEQPASRLSYGQQKLLELGRVLMARPKMILLDEPTAGVNPTLIRQIVELVFELRDSGVRFFLVEHNMPLVAELCDRLLVMDSGELIFQGAPEKAVRDHRVVEAYLGKMNDAA